MLSEVLLLICSGLVVYFLFFYQSRSFKMLSHLATPTTIPWIGMAFELNVSNELLFKYLQFATGYGNGAVVAWVVNQPYVMIGRADWIQKLLSSSVHIDKSPDYQMTLPWLGTGLLTSGGNKWLSRRKMLTPAFHFKILDCFLDIMNEHSVTLIQILDEKFGKDGQAFDICPYITRCALDIICDTAMGKKVNSQQQKDSEYVKSIYRISQLIQHRQVRPWLHPNFLWRLSPSGKEEMKLLNILHSFTESVIKERKVEIHQRRNSAVNEIQKDKQDSNDSVFMKEKRRVAFLDLLLTAQAEVEDSEENSLTDLDIRHETDTFMFEGHDTTASSTGWATFLLASHPEYQEKVYEELYSIFGEDRERPVTNQDLSRMKYLECCIKEALRIYPAVPFIGRSIKSDFQLDEQTTIPAGATVIMTIYELHRDKQLFPEPEAFFPDRFLPENCEGRNNFAYLPFSGGPRNCIGQKFAMMEEKVMLANIFRNFKVEAAERREKLILLAEIVLRSKNGLHVKLTRRPKKEVA